MTQAPAPAILELRDVSMAYARPDGASLPVLSNVDLSMRDGEILGLLGRSGSGKSTLLRIAAGLIKPTSGQVLYRASALTGPEEGIAVVFQSFALYPWLTVQENVELGLDALRLADEEVRRRCASAIDLIGLDGFQSAYPRELSGGMRQRVGFARALVSEPTMLLMDEPFSALDVLTAETLRTDFIDLWIAHALPTRAALLVTHNIEEAVLMCDRILVLGSSPGHICAEVPVALPQPRDRLDAAFRAIVDQIYSILTSRMTEAIGNKPVHGGMAQLLPQVSVSRLSGLLKVLSAPAYAGHARLSTVARPLSLSVQELMPVAAALHILRFLEFKDGAVTLTAAGLVFARSSPDERKKLCREHLLRFVPFVAHIHQVLQERDSHSAPLSRFKAELEDHFTARDADAALRTAIGWGRYAQLFSYDDEARTFRLSAP